jgi:hypothetical protein
MDLAEIVIKVDTRDLKSANDEIGALAKTGKKTETDVNNSVGRMDKGFKGLGSTLKLVGSAFAALGVVALGKSFADTVTETERLKGSLVTVTGSTDNAAMAFDKLLGFASSTPFTLDQSVTAFTRLSSLGLAPSEKALTSYGNTAAAMGKDMMQMIEAVADASTGEFERLKEFGIRASKQGEQVSFTFQGVTTTVGMESEKIQEYLMSIGEVQFAGAMENQMKRLPGLFSNLADQVTKFFLAIGDAGGVGLLSGAVTALSGGLGFLTDNIDLVVQAVTLLGVGLGTYFGVAATAALVSNFAKIRTAIIAMNVAIAANPIGAVATAIAIAATAIILNWDKIKTAATTAGINIQIAWEKLKLYFMRTFSPVLSDIADKFIDIKIEALSTLSGIKAAAKDPLDAIDAFNEAANRTEEELRAAYGTTQVFAEKIADTETNIIRLEGELNKASTTTSDLAEEVVQADINLEDLTNTLSEPGGTNDSLNTFSQKAQDVIDDLANQKLQLNMTELEWQIYQGTLKAGADATPEQRQAIIDMTTDIYNQKGAIEDAAQAEKDKEEAVKTALQNQRKLYDDFHKDISGFFVDLFTNGRDAFDNLAKRFADMLKKMVADFLASKILDYLGKFISSIGGAASSFGSFLSSAASSIAGSAAGGAAGAAGGAGLGAAVGGAVSGALGAVGTAASQFVGGLTGGAFGANAMMPTIFSQAGATLNAAIFNPITAALAGLLIAWKIFGTKSTPSFNAGFMLSPLGIAGEYPIAPFASGIQPAGFLRRADREQSDAVIETFRALDASIVDLYKQAGINFKLSGAGISGYAETGLGYGRFYGAAGEEGKPGVPIEDQLTRYAKEMFEKGSYYGLPEKLITKITSAGNYADMLERAQGMIDGSHAEGLNRVPYDGYVAELHAGERVLTASQTDAQDSMAADIQALRQDIGDIMLAVARNTSKQYRIYDRWDKNGLPPTRS